VLLWDAASGREIRVIYTSSMGARPAGNLGPNFVSIHWSPDAKLLAVDGWIDGSVRLLNATNGQETKRLQAATAPERASVSWSPHSDYLASSATNERTIRVWNSATWQEVATLRGLSKEAVALAWSSDGSRIASYGVLAQEVTISDVSDQQVHVLLPNVREQELPEALRPYWRYAYVDAMMWSPDGKYLGLNAQGAIASLWNTSDWSETHRIYGIRDITWSPDGKQFAALEGETLSTWTFTPFGKQSLGKTPDYEHELTWSPVGNLLAMGSDDGTLCIWTLPPERR
jgi:WD40 repeat protein